MKKYAFPLFSAIGAFLTLSVVAVLMGGINQDEGWYLYAANLVAEGKVPYRDFFFTQGPLMPIIYSAFSWVWKAWGLLGARIFTLLLGAIGIFFACAITARNASDENRASAVLITFLLLATNIYHLYYLAMPKAYALAALLVLVGFWLLGFERAIIGAGFAFALSAGTRISLGLILPLIGLWLLFAKRWKAFLYFAIGGSLGLALIYGPFLFDANARAGLISAQAYHAARGGFDPAWMVGSISRLVRWYLPVFVVLFMGGWKRSPWFLAAFLVVFALQIFAPFPYEDYQVPIMALLVIYVAINFNLERRVLLVMCIAFATSFGSPMLERWAINGQDRFWSLKKDRFELTQLREVAREIEMLDPGGKQLLTQDIYLAVETNRKVPTGLEMGPFSMLTDEEWHRLLEQSTCKIAALSGYTFAIEPPVCKERPIKKQMEYWSLLKKNYELVMREENFGQNATPLLILKHK